MLSNAPLAGVRVLDFSRVLSGPHSTRMLADLGAEVIKVEPPSGDLTRFSAPRRNGLASYFVQQNAGKANLSIDLATETGADIIRELCAHVDVVVENYRPGVMARLGLGPDTLLELNPRLIFASISGYGQDGPWVTRRAYAPVVEAESGIIASQGAARNGALAKDPHSHADVYTGLEASAAIVAALFQRERTGRGQTIDVSMAETMLYVNEHLHDALWEGDEDPQWIRSFRPGDYIVMQVANGESLIVSGHPAERGTFDLFLAAMDRADLADDFRFRDVKARIEHYDELREIIIEFASTISDPDEFERIFAAHGLAVGRVREPGDLARTDWAEARNATVEIDDRMGGTITVPNAPWHFSDGPDVGVHGVAKYRGEDNRSVLGELLGYDDERLDELESERIISSRLPR
ncbi:CaiB/BaiF CoA transferase family protein [Ilumatobacter sp.]|uniref:CaiB/BaiF CoA transferase family protein n=1 Tax=Ilumatobacter sp. TaxID=1967498 RepID=UPI003C4F95CE